MSVRFGMAGTGAMAVAMLPAFRHAPDADLVAVSSSSNDRAQEFASIHGIEKSYGGFDAMLDDASIDAVYVANRTRDHASASITALQAGKHVLCEKPFALSANEGEKVIAAARASGKLFMEGLWTHFLPAYLRVHDLVQSSEVGEAKHLVAGYGYPTSPEVRPRLFYKDDGGVLLDIAVYPISLALRLMGPVDGVDADIKRNGEGVETHASLQLHHDNGATSQLVASFDVLTANAATVACREGQISIPAPLFGAEQVVVERFSASSNAPGGGKSGLKAALKQNPVLRRVKNALSGGEHHAYGADQYLPQMRHFTSLVERHKLESDIATHALSMEVLRVIDGLRDREGA
ncbi:MAG: Gfo/Idh/MocA family oxidoreductase [Pseudomonadota bacterium]